MVLYYSLIFPQTMGKCSCCSVKTTCLVVGVVAVLTSVSRELFKTYKGVAYRNKYRDIDAHGKLLSFLSFMGELMDVLEHVLCIGMVVATAFLFYGMIRKDDKFLLPVIWFLILDFLGRSIFSLYLFINVGFSYPISLTNTMPFVLVIIFDIFFWVCVCSYKRQLISTIEDSISCTDVMCNVRSSKTPFVI